MRPHLVRKGEHLHGIAYRNGSTADAVIGLAENSELKAQRAGGNTLAPGDLVMLPNPSHPAPVTIEVGGKTTLRATIPRVRVRIRYDRKGEPIASEPWHIEAAGEKASGTSGADGLVEFQVRVTTRRVRLVFDRLGISREIHVGGLDPIDTPSGVAQRLRNLGMFGGADPETFTVELLAAIVDFQKRRGLGLSEATATAIDPPTASALSEAHGS